MFIWSTEAPKNDLDIDLKTGSPIEIISEHSLTITCCYLYTVGHFHECNFQSPDRKCKKAHQLNTVHTLGEETEVCTITVFASFSSRLSSNTEANLACKTKNCVLFL